MLLYLSDEINRRARNGLGFEGEERRGEDTINVYYSAVDMNTRQPLRKP